MFVFDKAPFPSCHASTVVEPEPGELACAWFGGKGEGASDVKIWLARFEAGKWSAPEVVGEEAGVPCWNPVLFKSRSGILHLWYKIGKNPMSWTAFHRRSADGGRTWDRPRMHPAGLLGPIRAKPVQLADGRILAPSSVESHRAWTSYVEISADDGKTWTRSGPIVLAGGRQNLIQPTLFEANGGRLVALLRSRDPKRVCRSESADGGLTWTEAVPTALPNPNSGIDAVKAAGGAVFLVYNDSPLLRTPLVVARSADDGTTWTAVAKLEEAIGEYSYPAMIESADGKLQVTYTWNRTHIKHVTVDPKG